MIAAFGPVGLTATAWGSLPTVMVATTALVAGLITDTVPSTELTT